METPERLAGPYQLVDQWPHDSEQFDLVDVAGVAVSPDDEIYVFARGRDHMLVFAPDGTLVRRWDDGIFTRPHGVDVGPDGSVYCTDDGDHTVRKCTPHGEVVLQLGVPGKPSAFMSGAPFNRCTHTALSPDGDIYVTDGYSNAHVHKFTADGTFLFSWGEPGVGPGQFNLPHGIATDTQGLVYVADRENHRVQIFSSDGGYLDEWRGLHRPAALARLRTGSDGWVVGELAPTYPFQRGVHNLGPRLSQVGDDGRLRSRIDSQPPRPAGTGPFIAPHGISVDSRGAVYVAEVAATAWPLIFPKRDLPHDLSGLRKLQPIEGAE